MQTSRPFAVALAALLLPAALLSQSVRGAGDDAITLPAGALRAGVATQWSHFYERYANGIPGYPNGSLVPLGAPFSFDSLGIGQFANLAPVQSQVRALAGMPDFSASLGKSVVHMRNSTFSTPIAMEFGVTSRITVGVNVPFVTATSDVDFRINPAQREATLGLNPALTTPAANTANAALLAQFDAAAAQLNQRLAACATTPGDAGCASLNANRASAQALINDATNFATALARVYGGRTGFTGAAFVPIAGTAAQAAIDARVAGYKALYSAFGNSTITGTGPFAAQTPLALTDAQRLFTDPGFGLGGKPLATSVTRGLGDIDLSLKVNLIDPFGRDARARLAPTGFRWRQTIGGTFRLGTGTLDAANDFTDMGTGDHQNDIELQSYTDLLYGSHFWVSLVARYNMQMADERVMRITDSPAEPLAGAYRQQTVTRDLGDVFDFQISPRWTINDYVVVAGHYYYRHKAPDAYAGRFDVTDLTGQLVTLDASLLNLGTGASEHRFGGGLSYSTVAAFQKGKAGIPLEFSYSHYQTTLGSGGYVPKITQDEVQLRVYAWWRRR